MPKFDNIHTLSVSRSAINAITFSKAGDWIALGCAALGQLLVWEWRSESYILKQQGHYYDIATSAFSPDGANLATGADDSKVQLLICLCCCSKESRCYAYAFAAGSQARYMYAFAAGNTAASCVRPSSGPLACGLC